MRRRRLLLFGIVAATGALALWEWSRPAPRAKPSEQPFTDLEQAITRQRQSGWELLTRPQHPGPYRPTTEESAVGGGGALICRVRDEHGTVVEDLRVQGDPAFDQLAVYLETPGGRRTVAVLKRPR